MSVGSSGGGGRAGIVALALPATAELLFVTLVQFADLAMVGHLGTDAIAAVGLVSQVVFLAMGILPAVADGGLAVAARLAGAGDKSALQRVVQQCGSAGLLLGLLTAAVLAGLSSPILSWMGAEGMTLRLALPYMLFTSLSTPFLGLQLALTAQMRAVGDMRTPMWLNSAANVANIGLNWVLINGMFGLPALGVTGAGVAIVLARAFAAGWAFVAWRRGIGGVQCRSLLVKPDWAILRRVFGIGLPSALDQLFVRFGHAFVSAIAVRLGTAAFAAHQIVMNLSQFAFLPGLGFGIAAATLVGQALGAGRPDEARRAGWRTAWLGTLVVSALGVATFLGSRWLVSLYQPDADVLMLAAAALQVSALSNPALGLRFVLAGALRGAGDTQYAFWSTVVGVGLVRMLGTYVAVQWFGADLNGIWYVFLADFTLRALLLVERYRRGRWATA